MHDRQYHAVSVAYESDGLAHVHHTRVDVATRKIVTEELASFEPAYGPPATWQEHLLIGVSELLARQEEEQLGLF